MAPIHTQPYRQCWSPAHLWAAGHLTSFAASSRPKHHHTNLASSNSSSSSSDSASPSSLTLLSPLTTQPSLTLDQPSNALAGEQTNEKVTKILNFLEQEVLTAHQETEQAKADKVSAEQNQVQAEASLMALRVVMDNVFHKLSFLLLYCSVPEHLKTAPYTAAKLKELFDNRHIYITQFSCPLCRVHVASRPIEIYQFKDLVHEANQLFGQLQDLAVADSHLGDDDIWADIFYKDN
ncbi:hypothetical protein BDN67DRAFT_985086 [Paxillus ammoniavirescens]|nr:hypothetical protein BDN67DRAFT_985086 [Paxillus ammoniavirescens]